MSDTPRTDELYEIPAAVIEAARTIIFWAATNGLNDFAIGEICSRKHLSKLERELNELKKGEFICPKCGLRKNDEHQKGDF